MLELPKDFFHFFKGISRCLHDGLEIIVLEVVKIRRGDVLKNFILFAARFILKKNAFPEIPRRHSGRLKLLNLFEDLFQIFLWKTGIFGNFIKGAYQIPIIVNIFYNPFSNKPFLRIKIGKAYLPSHMVPKIVGLADTVLIVGRFLAIPWDVILRRRKTFKPFRDILLILLLFG